MELFARVTATRRRGRRRSSQVRSVNTLSTSGPRAMCSKRVTESVSIFRAAIFPDSIVTLTQESRSTAQHEGCKLGRPSTMTRSTLHRLSCPSFRAKEPHLARYNLQLLRTQSRLLSAFQSGLGASLFGITLLDLNWFIRGARPPSDQRGLHGAPGCNKPVRQQQSIKP